jgi:tRNA dimethylallyltransferase
MKLPVIVGPTAVGKTALAVQVASRIKAEVISADSRQIYRRMDIGTAKPTKKELRAVTHHMIDFINPDEHFGAGQYGREASAAAGDVAARGMIPLVVGGSGLYVRALIEGFFSAPPVDISLRQEISKTAKEKGVQLLHEKLRAVDPEAARRIHPNDLQRISRALEVYEQVKTPMSALQKSQKKKGVTPLYIGLARDREELRERIENRVDAMVALGFVKEVEDLLNAGYSPTLNSFRAVGYREMASHIAGEVSLDQAIAQTKKSTRAFARRQMTWFKALPNIRWIELSKHRDESEAIDTVSDLIEGWIN